MYADLEESNLFLIQVCQESEEQLEEIKGRYRETQEQMNEEVAGLQVCSAPDKSEKLLGCV